MSEFHQKLMGVFLRSLTNSYHDNFDYQIRKLDSFRKLQLWASLLFDKLMRILGRQGSMLILTKSNYFLNQIHEFEGTYDLLNDKDSQKKMIELLAFKALGFTKVKLSLNDESFNNKRSEVEFCNLQEFISLSSFDRKLYLYDLKKIGYDIRLYFVTNGIFVDFILEQYSYQDIVFVNPGDVVVDAGGCWGDASLYFTAIGARDVYAYEFIPSNLEVFKRNLSLNANLRKKIHIIDSAVWSESGITLSFEDKGPASRVGEAGKYSDGETVTLSIDDLVREQGLGKVDFIKMDIEGAEMPALRGAEETIRRFKPKLAISAYHKPDDLITIPMFIKSLNPNYKFYLDYYTIIGDEIILYAINE